MADVMLDELRTFLLASTAIAAAVVDRVSRINAPQQKRELPRITYEQISNVPGYNHEGEDGTCIARVQVNCIAKLPGEASTLAGLVANRLGAFVGLWNAVVIDAVFRKDAADQKEQAIGGEDTRRYVVRSDFEIHYGSPVPDNT